MGRMIVFLFTLLLTASSTNASFFGGLLAIPSRLQCYMAYNALDFELTNYGAYATYFRDDSVMILAQTGEYKGLGEIEEYVRFTAPNSVYLVDALVRKSETRVGGLSETYRGQCVFDVVIRRQFSPRSETTNPEVQPFDALSMVKLFFDKELKYVSRIHLYFPGGVVDFVFRQVLGSENTRRYVCENLAGSCASVVQEASPATCLTDMEALPVLGEGLYADGNTFGCRALHASFASQNPMGHCAHVSLDTTDLDANGENKCSTSKNVPVESLIDAKDLKFFENFARAEGFDPKVGFIHPSPSFEEPGWMSGFLATLANLFNLVFGGLFSG